VTKVKKVEKGEPPEPRRTIELVETKSADPRKLFLEAARTMDSHMRMLGDVTGIFKSPQPSPRNVTRDQYNELVDMFVGWARTVNPSIDRAAVVEVLAQMPAAAGDFLPLVQEELGRVM
jgi:hypothetical protein